jgi:hypothetical protein
LIACANCWRPAAKLKAFNRKVREERPLRTETYPVREPYKDGFLCDLRDLFAIFAVKGFAFLCFGKSAKNANLDLCLLNLPAFTPHKTPSRITSVTFC